MGSPRTGILVILDGFGHNADPRFNAIASAKMPQWKRITSDYPHTLIEASESNVGLPAGFMGNSEVGHLNIGAGRVVYQDFSLISRAIEEGSFFENPAFLDLLAKLKRETKGTLHLMGLVSDGGVHSHLLHLQALLQLAKKKGVHRVVIHAFLDGRDTAPTSGVKFLQRLQAFCQSLGIGEIGTVMGRFYAMDRDKRWERTQKAYDAIVAGQADHTFTDPVAYVETSYDESVTDEFVLPCVRRKHDGVRDGDGIIFFNFRADRARQLTQAITDPEFSHFRRQKLPALSGFVQMTPYDEKFPLPFAYQKPEVPETLGEIVSKKGWKQLRIAETEKYAHVTYFFNGGMEKPFDGEKRVLIPSPKEVRTYDLKPEMSAREITQELLKHLDTKEFRFAVVNFANADMVGHTGNFAAAVRAVETLDECLGKIVDWVERNEAFAVITADHGNCEMMQDAEGVPLTSHTLLPVPFVVVDPNRHKEWQLKTGGKLCDIAPTILNLMEMTPPAAMTGRSLLGGA